MKLFVLAALVALSARAVDEERTPKTPEPRATMEAPTGLSARQTSPTQILLTWEKVPGAQEYRVYVTPPPAAQLTGRPGVVGGSGDRFIITVPPSVPPSTWYRASIEAVGLRGAKSQRVDFNPVMLMRAQAPGGPGSVGTGPAATPQTSAASLAGQACPPGQFVTGFSSTGTVVCASPPTSVPASGPTSAPAR
jgi:hypothetical protein